MNIIDAHLHFFPESLKFDQSAQQAGDQATIESLTATMAQNKIVLGIGMGTTPTVGELQNPLILTFVKDTWPPFFAQCLGVNADMITNVNKRDVLSAFENKIKEPRTVGIKIYAGYQHFYVSDPIYHPFYELAEHYDVPVVIHTGDTANSQGLLKYSHPLTIDEVAVNFPRTNFVMAHYGNPWIVDATEVIKKNPNVYADLSGLAEGNFSVGWFFKNYHTYADMLVGWLTYLSRYDKLMYGSDWPLVNMGTYIDLIKRIIPQEQHEAVFFENAKRIFKKINTLPVLNK